VPSRKAEEDKKHFVVEIPLKTTPHVRAKLRRYFNVYTHVYNAILRQGKKRVDKIHRLPEWQRVRELGREIEPLREIEKSSRRNLTAHQKERLAELRRERREYDRIASEKSGFSNFTLQKYVNKVRKRGTFIWDNTISTLCNTLSKRAYLALDKYKWGKAKKVTFRSVDGCKTKRLNNCITCLSDGNSSSKVFIMKDGHVVFRKMVMPYLLKDGDVYHRYFVENPDLVGELKLVRRLRKGRWYYCLQATMSGDVPRKHHNLGVGEIGLDIGPTLIAYSSPEKAELRLLTDGLTPVIRERIILERRLDRQRRINNPECYDAMGRYIPGKKLGKKSKRQIETETQIQEMYRREREHRKCLQGELANKLRSQGDVIHTEKLNIKAWQKRKKSKKGTRKSYGKSIRYAAPAAFLSMLKFKFESTNGKYRSIPTSARLSQTCPRCGDICRKSIGERIHRCQRCGHTMQRDLVSALLAVAVVGNEIDGNKALRLCVQRGPLLRAACASASAKVFEEKPLASRFGSASELKSISEQP
jgi:putative transposase